jgi:hypothetical protein
MRITGAVPLPRDADDPNPVRVAWRQQIEKQLGDAAGARFARGEFVECDACRAKPGAPTLCTGCIANRTNMSVRP